MGKNKVITSLEPLNNDTQVNTFWAVSLLPARTYVIIVIKLTNDAELKKNDMKPARRNDNLRIS